MHVKETLYAWIASNTKGRNGHRRPKESGRLGEPCPDTIRTQWTKKGCLWMEEAGDCRNDATKMHSIGSGILSRGNGHTCRMASGGKKEETSKKQKRPLAERAITGHRREASGKS